MSESETLTNRISDIIQNKEKISVKSSRINSDLEKYVHFILSEILNKFGQIRYLDMLYTILKELAINGIKANQKRIFFEENGLNIMDETQYAEGLVRFKASFS
ncbi:MAG TPA: histidine kinase, partial [Leptospiraceae bacterium]|nr:histidine kinase [Leptospiraceae bacterium]